MSNISKIFRAVVKVHVDHKSLFMGRFPVGRSIILEKHIA